MNIEKSYKNLYIGQYLTKFLSDGLGVFLRSENRLTKTNFISV